MTYKKFLVVASKQDAAGINITTQLSQFGNPKNLSDFGTRKTSGFTGFDFYLVEKDILHKENLDLDKIGQYDFIVFASKHKSKSREKTLSVHAPGNWRLAEYGGEKRKAGKTSSQFMKQFFEKLNENAEKYKLDKYKVTLEATHHGPLIDCPSAFVEIGSTENEWKDKKAAFVLARALWKTLENFRPNPYNENCIAIGGPHYCPNFNKIQLKTNYAISHIIPSYTFPLEEYMIEEAIEKTDEEIDFVLLDWKGLGKTGHRNRIIKILDDMHLNYKKTSEIKK